MTLSENAWVRIRRAAQILNEQPRQTASKPVKNAKTDLDAAKLVANKFRGGHGAKVRRENALVLEDGIRKYLQALRGREYTVGVAAHNAVLSVFSRAALHRECRRWFEGMPTHDVQSYNNCFTAYAKATLRGEMRQLWGRLGEASISPTTHTYVALLTSLKNDRAPLAKIAKILQQAKPWNIFLINSALGATACYEDAMKIFTHVVDKTEIVPDRFTLLALLGKCGGEGGDAKGVWKKMVQLMDGAPTVAEWTAYLAVFKNAGDIQGMDAVWGQLVLSVKPAERTYATYIQGCTPTASLPQGLSKYHEALKTYNATHLPIHTDMMLLCAAANDKPTADSVLANLQGLSLSPTPTLSQAYNRIGKK